MSSNHKLEAKIVLMLLAVCFIWGVTFPVMKVGVKYIPPLTFSGLRFIMGGVLLVVLTMVLGIPLPDKKDWGALAVLGVLQSTLTFGLVFYGMRYIEAGLASVLLYSYPLMINLMAHFFLRERLSLLKLFGLAVGFSGLVYVFVSSDFGAGAQFDLPGKILTLLAAVSWALATVYLKKRFPHHEKMQVTAWQMLLGGVAALMLAFVLERGQVPDFNLLSVSLLIYTAVVASSVAFGLWFYVLHTVAAGQASTFLFLVPVFGVASSSLALQEPFTASLAVGLIAVVAGIWLVNSGDRSLAKDTASRTVPNNSRIDQ